MVSVAACPPDVRVLHQEVRMGRAGQEIKEKHMAKKTEESFGERSGD